MKTISKALLLEHGYKERYDDYDKVVKFNKSIFDDKSKKKYEIEVTEYCFWSSKFWDFEAIFRLENGNIIKLSTVQWFNNDGRTTGNTIDDAERFIEGSWISLNCKVLE